MMEKNKIIATAFGVFAFTFLIGFNAQAQVQDFLHVPGPLLFHKSDYNLAWSSHPNDIYYKHEYVKSGDNPENFKEMVLLDFLTGKFSAKDLVSMKANELEERKKTDQVVNYQIVNSPDGTEYIIDFLVSSGKGETLDIIEWNAYRYKQVKDKSGKTGVLLFAISRRAYGEDISEFLKDLKNSRTDFRNELISYKLPEIDLASSK